MLKRGSCHKYMKKHTARFHYSCIGLVPPGHDTSRPYIQQPNDIEVEFPSRFLSKFILSHEEHKRKIENEMLHIHTHVCWPENVVPVNGLKICCLTNHISHAFAKTWRVEAPKKLKAIYQKYASRNICIGVKGRNRCIEEMTKPLKNIDPSTIGYDFNYDNSVLTLFGLRHNVDELFQKLLMVGIKVT